MNGLDVLAASLAVHPERATRRSDEADTILAQACAALAFLSGDARAAVQDRVQTFVAALDDHSALLAEGMTWQEYDGDLWLHEDPQAEAVADAADKVTEAGRAVVRALAEYMPREAREAAMAGQGNRDERQQDR